MENTHQEHKNVAVEDKIPVKSDMRKTHPDKNNSFLFN